MLHCDKRFVGQDVPLDGRRFVHCLFEECRLVYEGGEPPSITACDFRGVEVVFLGSAQRTVAFLQGISFPNSGLQEDVRQLFPLLPR